MLHVTCIYAASGINVTRSDVATSNKRMTSAPLMIHFRNLPGSFNQGTKAVLTGFSVWQVSHAVHVELAKSILDMPTLVRTRVLYMLRALQPLYTARSLIHTTHVTVLDVPHICTVLHDAHIAIHVVCKLKNVPA